MELFETPSFIRSAKLVYKRYPDRISDIKSALELLSVDPFTDSLKTHKLKGKLLGSYACSAGYDLRIVFQITKVEEYGVYSEAILLEAIGTHDDVY